MLFGGLEDFGTVQVEAQAMGCPVIAYGAGGALEAVRDGETGLLFHEQTAESMAQAMQRAEGQHFDSQAVRANAMRFSTENFRTRVMQVISRFTP